jgi:hypothetical protein
VYVGRATWLNMEFLPISFILHSGMLITGVSHIPCMATNYVIILAFKKDLYTAWLTRICTELTERLPTGFKLELSKRVFYKCKFLFIFFRWQQMICLFKCETNS